MAIKRGTSGKDRLVGTTSADTLLGLGGNDLLKGGNGNDKLKGSGGNDRLKGDAGADKLWGGSGNDVLAGGKGADLLNGGPGIDFADYSASRAGVEVWLIKFDQGGGIIAGSKALGGDAAGDTLIGIEGLIGSRFDDFLVAGLQPGPVFGGNGNDFLASLIGDSSVVGGAGNDELVSMMGRDILIGGDGNDLLRAGIDESSPNAALLEVDTMTGGAGNDVFQLFSGSDDGAVAGDVPRFLITDFTQGEDVIDFMGRGGAFIGTDPFQPGLTTGQVRYEAGDGFTLIQIDFGFGPTGSDGIADREIALTGQFTLAFGDFLL